MREYGQLGSDSAARAAVKEGVIDSGTEYARRFFIPPLTQFGRRMTALDNLIGERNLRFMGKVMSDEKLFTSYVEFLTGRKTLNDTLKNWALDYEEKKSLTSDNSFILNIKKIRKKIS